MTYMDLKLQQRLVTDPACLTPRAEEDLFYDSFASVGTGLARLRRILDFWARLADHGPRAAIPPRTRKALG